MSLLSPTQKAALAARLQQADLAGADDATAALALSTRTMRDNPEPAPQIPATWTIADVIGKLADTTIAAIRDTASATDLIAKLNTGDVAGVTLWANALLKTPAKMTQTEANAVLALINATIADPNWPPQIATQSWAETNFPGVEFLQPDGSTVTNMVTSAMVAEARS